MAFLSFFKKMARENPKHVPKWGESEGAKVTAYVCFSVRKQEIFFSACIRGVSVQGVHVYGGSRVRNNLIIRCLQTLQPEGIYIKNKV